MLNAITCDLVTTTGHAIYEAATAEGAFTAEGNLAPTIQAAVTAIADAWDINDSMASLFLAACYGYVKP